jgi:uncharacterized membrane protein
MKLSYLWRGLPGHPLHPPLTDATIGAYTAATVMAFASFIGVAHIAAAHGWWLAMVIGLIATAVHGMRVLSLAGEPPGRAVAPVAHPEKEEAEA